MARTRISDSRSLRIIGSEHSTSSSCRRPASIQDRRSAPVGDVFLNFMSIEPAWYSTIFMVILLIGQILATFALITWLLARFAQADPFAAGGATADAPDFIAADVEMLAREDRGHLAEIAFQEFIHPRI